MAKQATAKGEGSKRKQPTKARSTSGSGERSERARSSKAGQESQRSDPVDALIKLLQSPLVIDLLAVGATAALAAITEHRSSRTENIRGQSKKTLKAAGKAAAAAIGRRIASEIDEIRTASRRAREERTEAGETA